MLAGALALSALLIGHADAQSDESFVSQFHSFIPAKPSFRLPGMDDIKLWKDDMDLARAAWRARDYGEAKRHLEAALQKGNVLAAWYLGNLYRLGRGVPADAGKAFDYYNRVAANYNEDQPNQTLRTAMVDALVRVADAHREGLPQHDVAKDPQRAFSYYMMAAGHDHPGAAFGLAAMYLRGLGVSENPKRALRWLSRAAKKRYPPAAALLGDLYWSGKHVRKDRALAVMWYMIAQQTANPKDHAYIFARLDQMLDQVSDDDRIKAEAVAADWAARYPQDRPLTVAD